MTSCIKMVDLAERWAEFVLQFRVQYLMFKRSVWMFETLLFFIAALLVHMLPLSWEVRIAVITVCFMRALTEALNHAHLARDFGVADRYPLLAPFT